MTCESVGRVCFSCSQFCLAGWLLLQLNEDEAMNHRVVRGWIAEIIIRLFTPTSRKNEVAPKKFPDGLNVRGGVLNK